MESVQEHVHWTENGKVYYLMMRRNLTVLKSGGGSEVTVIVCWEKIQNIWAVVRWVVKVYWYRLVFATMEELKKEEIIFIWGKMNAKLYLEQISEQIERYARTISGNGSIIRQR